MGLVNEEIEMACGILYRRLQDIPEYATSIELARLVEVAVLAEQLLVEEIDVVGFQHLMRGSEVVLHHLKVSLVGEPVGKLV